MTRRCVFTELVRMTRGRLLETSVLLLARQPADGLIDDIADVLGAGLAGKILAGGEG